MTDRELLYKASDALIAVLLNHRGAKMMANHCIAEITKQLEQPEPFASPVGRILYANKKLHTVTIVDTMEHSELPFVEIYTRPVNRQWVGLTEEEFYELLSLDGRLDSVEVPLIADLIRAVQTKLREKNT